MRIIRYGVCSLIAFTVAAFGGVEWWGVATVEVGAAVLFLVWGALAIGRDYADLQWNWLFFPMLGIAVLVGAQQTLGLSAYHYATKVEIVRGVAYLMLCFVVANTFRTSEDRISFAWFLVTLSFIFALFGIAQRLAFDGKLYWLIPVPDGAEPFASFVNRDHFAGFVELTAPIGLALLFNRAHRSDKSPLLVLFTAISTVALLLSGSRGGIVSFAVAVFVVAILSPQAFAKRRRLIGALSLGMVIVGVALWLGARSTIDRFAVTPEITIAANQRVTMDRGTWNIFLSHRWIGAGLGTLETVYPHFALSYDKRTVDHAHNDYLEFLAETGGAGGLLGLGFIAVLLTAGIWNLHSAHNASDRAFTAGGLAACAALLVHSFVDFNLHIPSNTLLFLLLATLICSSTSAQSRYDQMVS